MFTVNLPNDPPSDPIKAELAKVWRVLCVDDHPDIRLTLQLVIDAEEDMECAGCLSSADKLVEETGRICPDVVLMDATMPGKDPFDALRELREKFPQTPTIVFSAWADDQELIDRAVSAGARGWVDKCGDAQIILLAVREVAVGGRFFSSMKG